MSVQVVIFQLGEEEYAMPIDIIREITRLGEMRRIPQAPSYICGLITLRDEAIPIIDLHERFSFKNSKETQKQETVTTERNTFALITEVHGENVGFAVDEVREVRIFETISPPPPLLSAPFIGGIVNLPDRIIIHLIPEQILLNDEVQKLSQLK
ncbi:chemotaxis signal transduction protein [Desulfosporosinus acidiphilus SJ4]|uniref:Chemotaxis signal transduction protein n=1 Tax=Desulfosporosinus acidiphilus (strain DSM 22704 / JCM 16185 / SJ4) TaxID=646529 RepID=I4DA55_DESAJ|nr:chemotaxis protein CheW [Desulfosporosinus acidiphilus]AFM42679.1 chemotaxis signal transduction protein [Desulfosporosinus acidiphilus SJ4]